MKVILRHFIDNKIKQQNTYKKMEYSVQPKF